MRSITLLRILTISLMPMALTCSGCNPLFSPSYPTTNHPVSILHASGVIYGTPLSFDNSEYGNIQYDYLDTVCSGFIFNIYCTVVNQDQPIVCAKIASPETECHGSPVFFPKPTGILTTTGAENFDSVRHLIVPQSFICSVAGSAYFRN